jgi:hypothetical protein
MNLVLKNSLLFGSVIFVVSILFRVLFSLFKRNKPRFVTASAVKLRAFVFKVKKAGTYGLNGLSRATMSALATRLSNEARRLSLLTMDSMQTLILTGIRFRVRGPCFG